MNMDLQDFFKQKNVILTGMALARLSPRQVGYSVAELAGNRIADEKPRVYWQMRENISHIPGTTDPPEKLDELTRRAFINAGKYYYDFYNIVGRPVEVVCNRVEIEDHVLDTINAVLESGRGVQLAGIHMSNFDLGTISLCAHGLDIMALSAADPNDAYKVQNELRAKYGFSATPINPASLREAINRLRSGQIIATGLDWPHHEETQLTEVFGKPAFLPLGTARLALLGDALTFVIAFYSDENMTYRMHISEPLEVIRTGNKENDIRLNTQAYVRVMESFLIQHPDQWMMYHKFWADDQTEQPD
jgi:KDO2-lipid IV(A) lauroyltransferase